MRRQGWDAREAEIEAMEVPRVLSPVYMEPRILGQLLKEQPVENKMTLRRWLSKGKGVKLRRVAGEPQDGHMRRLLKTSIFPWR